MFWLFLIPYIVAGMATAILLSDDVTDTGLVLVGILWPIVWIWPIFSLASHFINNRKK
jgi:hypothetical protein